MNVTFDEKHGASWKLRLLALCLVALGALGGWAWHGLQAPEGESQMQLLSADAAGAAATERLLAKALENEGLDGVAAALAARADAEPANEGFWARLCGCRPPRGEAAWRRILQGCFRSAVPRERVLAVTARFRAFGAPRQAQALEELCRAMEERHAEEAAAARKAREHAREAELRRLTEEVALLRPDPEHAAAAREALEGLREALERREAPSSAWQRAWAGSPALAAYVAGVTSAWDAWLAAARAANDAAGKTNALAAWVAAPQNQTVKQVVRRVVHHADTPEMMRLKDRKAELEAERSRLLLRVTPLHPLAKRLAAAIAELEARINALDRLPQTVEDVEERTNPRLVVWKRELADAQTLAREAAAAEDAARRDLLAALAALEQADQAESALAVQKSRLALERRQEKLRAERDGEPAATPPPFVTCLAPTAPRPVGGAPLWLAMAVGAALGALAGLAVVWGRRESRFQCAETPPPAPEYPVLGVVPDFSRLD